VVDVLAVCFGRGDLRHKASESRVGDGVDVGQFNDLQIAQL